MSFLHVPDGIRDLVKGRMTVYLIVGRLEERPDVLGAAGHNGIGRHYPQRTAFAAACVQIPCILQSHFLIEGMEASTVHKWLS